MLANMAKTRYQNKVELLINHLAFATRQFLSRIDYQVGEQVHFMSAINITCDSDSQRMENDVDLCVRQWGKL